MPERVDETLLRLTADKASADKTARVIAQIKNRLGDLKTEERALEAARRQGVDTTDDFSKVIQKQTRYQELLNKLQREYRKSLSGTADEERQIAQQRARFETADLAGDVESRTRAVTGAVGFIGGEAGAAFERNVNIGAELLAAGEGLGKLSQELPQFISRLGLTTAQFGVLGIAAAAAGVAIIALNEANKQEAELARARIAQTETLFQEINIRKLSSDQIREEIATRQASFEAGGRYLQQLQLQRAEAEANTGELRKAIQSIDGQTSALEEYDKKINEVREAQEAESLVIASLFGALNNSTTAANDMRAAEERLAATRQAEANRTLGLFQEQIANEVNLNKLRRDGNSEAIKKQLEDIELERQLTQEQIDVAKRRRDSAEITQEEFLTIARPLNESLRDLTQQYNDLNQSVLPAVQAREAEAEAAANLRTRLTEISKAREAEAKQLEKLTANATAYRQTVVENEAKRQQAITQEAEDFNLKRQRDLADHYADMADEDAKYYDQQRDVVDRIAESLADVDTSRLDTIRDYNRDAERAARDHARALRNIQRDADRDIQDAAERMNGAAILDARKARDRALEDAQEQYAAEQEERNIALDQELADLQRTRDEKLRAGADQLRDLQNTHRREQEERQRAFALRLSREDEDRRISLQRQEAAWTAERQRAAQHYASQQGLTSAHYNAVDAITAAGLTTLTSRVRTAMALISGAPIGSGAAPAPIPSIGAGLAGFAQNAVNSVSRAFGFSGDINLNISGVSDPERAADLAVQKIMGALAG